MWAPGTSTGTTTFCNFCWQNKFNFVPALHFVIAQLFFLLWLWLFFVCTTFDHYFCRYRSAIDWTELNWLTEVCCQQLPPTKQKQTKKKTQASKWQPTNSLLPSRCRPNVGRTGRWKTTSKTDQDECWALKHFPLPLLLLLVDEGLTNLAFSFSSFLSAS